MEAAFSFANDYQINGEARAKISYFLIFFDFGMSLIICIICWYL